LNFEKFAPINNFTPKPSAGGVVNHIDILPFEVTQEWYKNLKQKKNGIPNGIEPGFLDYKLEIPFHKSVGPQNKKIICKRLAFGKECKLCQMVWKENDKPEGQRDGELLEDLYYQWRVWYNFFDYDNQEIGVQLFDSAYTKFEQPFAEQAGTVCFSDLQEGKMLALKFRQAEFKGSTYYEFQNVDFLDRDQPYTEDILNDVYPLDQMLIIPSDEEIMAIFGGEGGFGAEEPLPAPASQQRRFRAQGVGQEPQQEKVPQVPVRTLPARVRTASNQCPEGGKFGLDFQDLDGCARCADNFFEGCGAENERLTKTAPFDSEPATTKGGETERDPVNNSKPEEVRQPTEPVRRARRAI
jgi:hypothetical protein